MPELDVGTREDLIPRFVRRFEAASRDAVERHGRFACALSGGSIVEAFYPALVTAMVDWRVTDVFWCDERAVPVDDPASNFSAAWRVWLRHVAVDTNRVHRMRADGPDLDRAAAEYAGELERTLGVPPRLDLALLGMGPDGHVCSLFPGHPALGERVRTVVAVHDAPKPPPGRVTITLPVLAAAARLQLIVFGEEKAEAVRQAIDDEGSRLPAALALRGAAQAVCMLDYAAARLLSRA